MVFSLQRFFMAYHLSDDCHLEESYIPKIANLKNYPWGYMDQNSRPVVIQSLKVFVAGSILLFKNQVVQILRLVQEFRQNRTAKSHTKHLSDLTPSDKGYSNIQAYEARCCYEEEMRKQRKESTSSCKKPVPGIILEPHSRSRRGHLCTSKFLANFS